jgi:hypothetical protein
MSIADSVANYPERKVYNANICVLDGSKELIPFCAGIRAAPEGLVSIKTPDNRNLL